MGIAIHDISVPVIKGTNAILALGAESEKSAKDPKCIRCGRCVSVCPMHLLPVYMYIGERNDDMQALDKLHLTDCMGMRVLRVYLPRKAASVQSFKTQSQAECFQGKSEATGLMLSSEQKGMTILDQELKLTVSSSPHIRFIEDTKSIMLDVIIALLPALAVAAYMFGIRALALTAVTVAGCIFLNGDTESCLKNQMTSGISPPS